MDLKNILTTPVKDIIKEGCKSSYGALCPHMTRRNLLKSAIAAGGTLTLYGAGTSIYRKVNAPARKENVFIIVPDSMMPGLIGTTVAGQEICPNLTAFSRECITFENAYAPSTQTNCSVASLLSGQYPQYHGVLAPGIAMPSIQTIASAFQSAGSFTFGLTTNPVIQPESGDKGYGYSFTRDNKSERITERGNRGVYFYLPPLAKNRFGNGQISEGYRPAEAMFAVAHRIISNSRRIRQGRPFLAYLHAMDTHIPYLSATPIDGITGMFGETSESSAEAWKSNFEMITKVIRARNKDGIRPVPDEEGQRRIIGMIYEATYRFDLACGNFFRALKSEGIYDRATIILASDHGEEIWQHGRLGHAQNLYDSSLRVPFLIRSPHISPRRITARVTIASIFPTLCELFSLPEATASNVVSLVPYMDGAIAPDQNKLTVLAALGNQEKVITPEGFSISKTSRGLEVYDINSDPNETRPLDLPEKGMDLERQSRLSKRMASAAGVVNEPTDIPGLARATTFNPDGTVNADTGKASGTDKVADQLRALGYLN